MAASSHHHIVSAGYLRFFAEQTAAGKFFVQQLDLETRQVAPRLSVRNVLTRSHHNSATIDGVRDDWLERQWQQAETKALPLVRRMVAGELDPREAPQPVIQLMAIHLARGAGSELVYQKIIDTMLQTKPDEFAAEPALLARVSADRIRDLAQVGLEQIDQERVVRTEAMGRHHNWFIDRFGEHTVQVIRVDRPRNVGFVTSDNPVVLADRRWVRVGVQRIAVGDAEQAMMTLSPRLAVALSRHPVDTLTATPAGVQRLNTYVRRAAVRFVVGHPDEDIRRAVAL